MSAHEEGILREVALACEKARLHGCAIDVRIKTWGHLTEVHIVPSGDATVTVDGTQRWAATAETEDNASMGAS